jgi:hypothetical protein
MQRAQRLRPPRSFLEIRSEPCSAKPAPFLKLGETTNLLSGNWRNQSLRFPGCSVPSR